MRQMIGNPLCATKFAPPFTVVKSLAVTCLAIGSAFTTPATAQSCPTPFALAPGHPTWWMFGINDGTFDAVGVIKLTVDSNGFGRLIGQETVNNAGSISRVQSITGSFTVTANDCSIGGLSFNTTDEQQSIQWRVFDNKGNGGGTATPLQPPAATAPLGVPTPLIFPTPGGLAPFISIASTFFQQSQPSLMTPGGSTVLDLFRSASPLSPTTATCPGNTGYNPPVPAGGPCVPKTADLGTMFLLSGPPTCSNPADPNAQMNSTGWNFFGSDIKSVDTGNFFAFERFPTWLGGFANGSMEVLGSSPSLTGATPAQPYQTNPPNPNTRFYNPGLPQLLGNAQFTGTYNVFGPDLNGDGGTCEGAVLTLGGNGTAYQYDVYFGPPYDGNGLPKYMFGVTSSTDVPNVVGTTAQGGSAALANGMNATRVFP